jgi:pimeloyl-ACP methyl ester carboxylesterase
MKTTLLIVLIILAIAFAALGFWLWTPDRSRSELEAKYLASPQDMIDIAGVRLHVRDTGPRAAPALILLHGFGSSLHTFEPWAVDLSEDYRVIRFDLPGSGLSEPDPTGLYTDARSIDIMLALMDHLGVAKASVIGNSIGGRLAWHFAAEHPERVNKLVLISPDGFASSGFVYGEKPEIPASLSLMRYVLPKALLRMSLVPAYANPDRLSDETVERYHALMLAPGSRDALLARMQQTILTDPVPVLKKITAPVLLLWGAGDAMIPITNAADYQRVLSDSTLVTLPTLGHLPFEEDPQTSLPPLREFLAN